jgi:hypothetical protein
MAGRRFGHAAVMAVARRQVAVRAVACVAPAAAAAAAAAAPGGEIHRSSLPLANQNNNNYSMTSSIAKFDTARRFQSSSASSLTSFSEPGTLFDATDLIPSTTTTTAASTTTTTTDRDAPLRADVRTMGRLLGRIIQDHHGPEIFNTIEHLRALAKQWRDAGAGRSSTDATIQDESKALFQQLNDTCANLTTEELFLVSRAFTHFLAIANAAEGHHRYRLFSSRKERKADSCAGVLEDLLHGDRPKATPAQIQDYLSQQKVELVLTAHPTEVNRRTILEKQRRVQEVSVCSCMCVCVCEGWTLVVVLFGWFVL